MPGFYKADTDAIEPYSNSDADASWQEVLAYASRSAKQVIDKMIAAGIVAPDVVGYELEDATGSVIGEAELAWESRKTVYLLPEQEQYTADFRSNGWRIITNDSTIDYDSF